MLRGTSSNAISRDKTSKNKTLVDARRHTIRMSHLEPLCDHCKHVELDVRKLGAMQSEEWDLGLKTRVLASKCPLCQLVTLALYEDNRLLRLRIPAGNVIGNISLLWDNQMSQNAGLGAFRVGDTEAVWLCFSGTSEYCDEMPEGSGPFFISDTPGGIDPKIIASWIHSCAAEHQECQVLPCPRTFELAFPGLEVLRLIDVYSMCIVEVREIPRYACLSYVWGSATCMRLTSSTLPELLKVGALCTIPDGMLPRTILDAIKFSKKVAMRYLWVDAWCLLQNDQEDLRRGVTVMDNIYEFSEFTIVAAEGHDANNGLPGVLPCTRATATAVEVLPGVSIGLWTELDRLLHSTMYETRGWTCVLSFGGRETSVHG